jgi:ATP-binding cassette subfamily F protein 3
MALLQVRDLDKFYGADPVLREVDFAIHTGEKWGLVGRNGCGKTTLLKILAGELDYDQGTIHWARNCRIGYLRQDPQFHEELSIYQELRALFGELDRLHDRLNEVQSQMDKGRDNPVELQRLIEEHHNLQEEYERRGGYQIEGRIQGVLRGLGIARERWDDSASRFSGGERTRLALAQLLLAENDLLLLDEPTNYLDIAAVEWLERYLAEYRGALLVISHDRFFLDRVANHILEIETHRVRRYRGNYSNYRSQKGRDGDTALKAYEIQQREIARQEKFIREAAAEIKRRAHSLEKRLERTERLERPVTAEKHIKMRFPMHHPSARLVMEVEDLSKRYGAQTIFDKVSFRLEAGEKVALIGANGAGKTTLLRLILGLETPERGRIRLGYEVYPDYFAQIDLAENFDGTPFSQVQTVADLDNTETRTLLGRFLFRGDEAFKAVADLSGGERRRLGLLKLVLSGANLLILDEPTNHLDLQAIEVLEEALLEYPGTIFFVSHDRYFLNRVASRFLTLDGTKILPFPDYQAYFDWRARERETGGAEGIRPKSEAQAHREAGKESQRTSRRRQKEIAALEAEIATAEVRRDELEFMVNDPAIHADYKKCDEVARELEETGRRLEEYYRRWEALHHDDTAQNT